MTPDLTPSFDINDVPPKIEGESRDERRRRIACANTRRWGLGRLAGGLCLQCGHPYDSRKHVRCDSCRHKGALAAKIRRAKSL